MSPVASVSLEWLIPVIPLREGSMSIDFRRAEPRDHETTYDIVTQAMTDLRVRRHNLPFPRAPEIQPRDLAFRQYAHEFHGESYWMAEDATRMVGFAIATRNDGRWHLGALHVIPEYQGQGIGRRLLDLTLSSAEPSDSLCVLTDSIQPVSTALYIRAGMLPWVPVLTWEGPIVGPVPDLPRDASFHVGADPEELDPVDRKVIYMLRRREHRFWMSQRGLQCGILSVDGRPAGYVYVSEDGQIGPAAATAEPLMRTLLLWAISRSIEQGADHLYLMIPGQCPSVQEVVLALRLTIRPGSTILLSSRPLWRLGQYLMSAGEPLL